MNEIRSYHTLPPEAVAVRREVFEQEQGFVDEFDETDTRATHLVLFEGNSPIGTCRVFAGEKNSEYILGRLAVKKPYRGKQHGRELIEAAEAHVRLVGGSTLALHAQCRAQTFYEKCGYSVCSGIEDDQGCPHVWMKKEW